MVCPSTLLRLQSGLLRRTYSSRLHSPRFDMTQSEIDSLPCATFPGRVVVLTYPEDEAYYRHEVATLRSSNQLGMDVEKLIHMRRSSFSCATCSVQLATEELCVVWRVQHNLKRTHPRTGVLWFSTTLKEILCDPSILKVGHGTVGDATEFMKEFGINTCNVFDAVQVGEMMKLKERNLSKLTNHFLGMRLVKKMQMSNWALPVLSKNQLSYAATDAWVSLLLYKSMARYAKSLGIESLPHITDTYSVLSSRLSDKFEERSRKLRLREEGHAYSGVNSEWNHWTASHKTPGLVYVLCGSDNDD